jgi:hypothetical protein
MKLPPENTTTGSWLDKKLLSNGDMLRIVSEAKIETGQNGDQLVAKVRVKGKVTEAANFAINKPSRKAIVEAYGDDTMAWVDKVFTVNIEKTMVAGKRGIAAYLVPPGYELAEDSGGFLVVQKIGSAPSAVSEDDFADIQTIQTGDVEGQINPEDLPF